MTVKGWLRAVMGLWASASAFCGLLTWHLPALVLGVGVLAVLMWQDEPVSEPVTEVPSLDLREARRRGRA